MQTRPHFVLTVEEDPGFRKLLKQVIGGAVNIQMEEAGSPGEGMKLFNKNHLYSVVWSGYQFKKPKINGLSFLKPCRKQSPLSSWGEYQFKKPITNGLEFLKFCRKQSPLSSRILCSGSLDDSALKSLVKTGDIHSYYSKIHTSKVIDSISSAVLIGFENYKINIFDNFLSINSLTQTADLDTLLTRLNTSLDSFPDNIDWELEDRELEKELLIDHIESSLDRSRHSTPISNILIGKDKNEKVDPDFEKKLNEVQDQITYLGLHLFNSKQLLKKSIEKSHAVSLNVAEREAKIKQLKAEFSQPITLQSLFKGGENIPTLPEVFYRFKEAVEDPDSSFEELAEVVASDPGLTARLLRIVNSPIYWFSNPVETIPHAISIIGGVQMNDLVLSTCIIDRFGQSSLKGLDMHLFWEHGIACGLSAQILAKHLDILNPESIFVGGLLHDIGRLVICLNAPDLFSEIFLKAQTGNMSLLDSENKILGFDHAQVGEELLKRWDIPKIHQETVRYHHNPMKAPTFSQEAALIDTANTISNLLCLGSSGELFEPTFNPVSMEILGMKDESFIMEVKEEIQEQYKKTIDSFL